MRVKIDDKSITTRFQVELAMKCAPRRPQDVSRRPQDAPKTPQDSQDDPKTAPRRAQDAPRTPPRTPQHAPRRPPGAENFGMKNGFLADPLHRRSQDAPRLPRRAQDGPKMRPIRPQDAPRTPPGRPKSLPRSQARWRGRGLAALKINENVKGNKPRALGVSKRTTFHLP